MEPGILNALLRFRETAVVKLLILIFICVAAFLHGTAGEAGFGRNMKEQELVDFLLESMTDEELLSQVFMLGFTGTTPSPEIMRWVRQRNVGGVKIFGWNAENIQTLTKTVSSLQEAALSTRLGIPLFVATDQEGGWIRHVKDSTSVTPGNLSLGAGGIPLDAYETGYYIGLELRAIGINMNFAPTVDVYSNPEAHVIGPRAFSANPVKTAVLATAYFKGMDKAGIICTAKHFPGHGDADEDSHGAMPVISISMETLWNRDLLPYRFLVREKLPAIMSGHIGFPGITQNKLPASLSSFFNTSVLREKLGFDGILITDDLYMAGALSTGFGIRTVCSLALESGNDMILLSRTPDLYDDIWTFLFSKLRNDPAFKTRIREAVRRILVTKVRYLKGENAVPYFPDAGSVYSHVPNRAGKDFFFQQACRSITVLKSRNFPLKREHGSRILLAGQFSAFLEEGKKRYPDAATFLFSYSPFHTAKKDEILALKQRSSNADIIIFCLSNPNSLEVLKALENAEAEVIVFSVLSPIYLRKVPWVQTAIAAYGTGVESFKAGFAALAGDFTPQGSLPVGITP